MGNERNMGKQDGRNVFLGKDAVFYPNEDDMGKEYIKYMHYSLE